MSFIPQAGKSYSFRFLCHFHTSWHTAHFSGLFALSVTKIDLITN